METKSVKKNYLYNLIYQILILILPIITTPYLSRALGAENLGIYSYTVTIVTYFTLFGSLGINLYGQREIAYVRDDKKKRKKIFTEVVFFRLTTMFIALLVFTFTFVSGNEYEQYYRILIIYLIASAVDISWFFQGLEEFKKTVARNVIVRMFVITKELDHLFFKFIYSYSLFEP